jgi:hypothetical protein
VSCRADARRVSAVRRVGRLRIASPQWAAASFLERRRELSGTEGLLQVAGIGRAGQAVVQEGDPGPPRCEFISISASVWCLYAVCVIMYSASANLRCYYSVSGFTYRASANLRCF